MSLIERRRELGRRDGAVQFASVDGDHTTQEDKRSRFEQPMRSSW
jgi:hypothetical protein